MTKILTAPAWNWLNAFIDGDDIVITDTLATCWGGPHDPEDKGGTASGVSTILHPEIVGCALPMRHDKVFDNKRKKFPLKNSPIPMMPFGVDAYGRDNPLGAHIDMTFDNGFAIYKVPAIDLGPACWTKHGLDITTACARKRIANATANNFERTVSYRIRGAAKFLS